MANESQYTVTFKTEAELQAAQQFAEALLGIVQETRNASEAAVGNSQQQRLLAGIIDGVTSELKEQKIALSESTREMLELTRVEIQERVAVSASIEAMGSVADLRRRAAAASREYKAALEEETRAEEAAAAARAKAAEAELAAFSKGGTQRLQEYTQAQLAAAAGARTTQQQWAQAERERVGWMGATKGLNEPSMGEAALQGLAGQFTSFATKATLVTAAVAAIKNTLGDALGEYAESQRASIALANALSQTGQEGEAAQARIEALSGGLQRLTNVQDEVWTTSAAKLIEYGAKVDELPDLLSKVEGVAGRMNGNIAQATNLVAKAVAGNTRELAQYGIHLEKGASQTEIMAAVSEVAASGQGKLREQTQGLTGEWQRMKVQLGDVMEGLGGVINSGDWLTKTLHFLNTGGVEAKSSLTNLSEADKQLKQSQDELATATRRLNEAMNAEPPVVMQTSQTIKDLSGAYDRLNQRTERAAKNEDAVRDARLATQKAQIAAAEQSGQINPYDATRARQNVERRAAEEDFQASQQRKQREVEAIQSQQESIEREARRMERAQENGEATDEEAAKARAFANEEHANAQRRVADIQAEIQAEAQLYAIKQQERNIKDATELKQAGQKMAKAIADGIKDAQKQAESELKKGLKDIEDAAKKGAKAPQAGSSKDDDDGRRTSPHRNDDRQRSKPGAPLSAYDRAENERRSERSGYIFNEPPPSRDISTLNRTVVGGGASEAASQVSQKMESGGNEIASALQSLGSTNDANVQKLISIIQGLNSKVQSQASQIATLQANIGK